MLKKIIAGCLLMGLCWLPGPAKADGDLALRINGDLIEASPSMGTPYINKEGRTMLPLRMVNNYLRLDTAWSEGGKIVVSGSNGVSLTLQVGQTSYQDKGETKALYSAPVIKDGRTYLPARNLAEIYGSIQWSEGTVSIYPGQKNPPSYRVDASGQVARSLASDRTLLPLSDGRTLSPIQDFIVKQKVIRGETYLLINYNHVHSNMSTLYKDTGDRLVKIADRVNATSSFTLNDRYLYYTDGTSQGPWSSGIRPNVVYRLDLQGGQGPVEKELPFDVNKAVLEWTGQQLHALTPDGNWLFIA
ncbi:copper amine oxidase N-terminal domain-containing protein [Peptococcus simiae]|uniref:copper amine oxidase N-terminal domain-containing protein n=1 Tax=Peptococcus simiae TaxID=1643805 RepID=UPI00397FA7CF